MTRKDAIRAMIRARRRSWRPARIRRAGARVQRAVMKLPEWAAARRVCVYLALPSEVATRRLLKACWITGKQVLVPAYRKITGAYAFARLRPDDRVKPGRWNVPQPERPRWSDAARVDLVLTPGLAFDRAGGRIGHGGGYYDRLLAGKKAFKVGLALECQMVKRVPMNARDVRLDAVVTERAVYRRRAGDGLQKTD